MPGPSYMTLPLYGVGRTTITLRIKLCCGLSILLLCMISATGMAQVATNADDPSLAASPSKITVPPEAQPSASFDAEAATNAYLAEISSTAKTRSDAYFEGGYWLILWDFLYGAVVLLLMLNLRWSAAMRNLSERVTRFRPIQTMIYWAEYIVLASLLTMPLTIYEDYFREHKYGLATQTFGPWMIDQVKDLGVTIVLGALLAALLFGVVRRLPSTWWIWGAVVTLCFVIFVVLIAPVYLVPIFNKVTKLDDPKITQPILSMARANGIPAN